MLHSLSLTFLSVTILYKKETNLYPLSLPSLCVCICLLPLFFTVTTPPTQTLSPASFTYYFPYRSFSSPSHFYFSSLLSSTFTLNILTPFFPLSPYHIYPSLFIYYLLCPISISYRLLISPYSSPPSFSPYSLPSRCHPILLTFFSIFSYFTPSPVFLSFFRVSFLELLYLTPFRLSAPAHTLPFTLSSSLSSL